MKPQFAYLFFASGASLIFLAYILFGFISLIGTFDLAIAIALITFPESKLVKSFAKGFGYASFGISFFYLVSLPVVSGDFLVRVLYIIFAIIAFVSGFLLFVGLKELK